MFRRRRRDVTAINRWQRAEPADGRHLRSWVYDVHRVGYPQRMRDHDARLRIVRRRAAGLSGG